VINFVITSLILSTLVGAFAVWGVRREMRAGRISAGGTPPRWLRRLPRRGWLAGLTLGAAAAVLVIAATWLLYSSGIATLALPSLLVVKSLYAGVLAFLVALGDPSAIAVRPVAQRDDDRTVPRPPGRAGTCS
jgi:hypothetical protein